MAAKTFRFDDVCINANMELVNEITDYLFQRFYDCEVIWAVSPLVHDLQNERVYPEVYNAYSDHRKFFEVTKMGIPPIREDVTRASHGLIHVDHRLMGYEAQEMSILISCSLVHATKFVPPFNKWNKITDEVCQEHFIGLVKFEQGWKCMEYNTYQKDQALWYLHARCWTMDKIVEWFK